MLGRGPPLPPMSVAPRAMVAELIESDSQAAKPLPQQARDIASVVQSVDSCREEVKGFSRVSDGGLQPGERG